MPDLSGNLAFFGLRNVLEMLADAGKSGELRVSSSDGNGRVLLYDGRVAYATTAIGHDTVAELDRLLARYEPGAVPDDRAGCPDTLEEAIEDQLTGVLYDLIHRPDGSFEFSEKAESSSAAPSQLVPVEIVLKNVDDRVEEWRELRRLIPTDDTAFHLSPSLPAATHEVMVDAAAWRLLALIGDGGSVAIIAGEHDISEFRAARALADLITRGLVRPVHEPEPVAAIGMVPSVEPITKPVTFSKDDLSRDEIDEVIRNIGRGIFPN